MKVKNGLGLKLWIFHPLWGVVDDFVEKTTTLSFNEPAKLSRQNSKTVEGIGSLECLSVSRLGVGIHRGWNSQTGETIQLFTILQ